MHRNSDTGMFVFFGIVGFAMIAMVVSIVYFVPGRNDIRRFPNGTTNIQDVGNGWVTFEVEIDGVKHKFLKDGKGFTEISPK